MYSQGEEARLVIALVSLTPQWSVLQHNFLISRAQTRHSQVCPGMRLQVMGACASYPRSVFVVKVVLLRTLNWFSLLSVVRDCKLEINKLLSRGRFFTQSPSSFLVEIQCVSEAVPWHSLRFLGALSFEERENLYGIEYV